MSVLKSDFKFRFSKRLLVVKILRAVYERIGPP